MNINAPDLQRLPPTEQLRHHVRRGQHREAIALALELLDDDTARRSAWRAIQSGSSWRLETSRGIALPILVKNGCDWLYECTDEPRWIRVEGSSVLGLWDDARARLFAADCAESALRRLERHTGGDLPRFAIEAARQFARGKAFPGALRSVRLETRSVPAEVPWGIARHAAVSEAWAVADDARLAARGAALPSALNDEEEYNNRRVIEPLMLRWMLLPVDELTTTSLEGEVAR